MILTTFHKVFSIVKLYTPFPIKAVGLLTFKQFLPMQLNLNVPKQLVKRYAASKRRKELLCFAIWLKMKHENSVAWGMNDRQVRYQCKVGKAKAIRILSDAAEDGLFDIKGETIIVHSFRDKTIKYGRNGAKYQADFCFKFPYKEDYTLRELYNLMNDFLATDYINAYGRKTACNADKDKNDRGASCSISLKSLSKKTNMSWSATRGIVNRLRVRGVLKITPSRRYHFLMAEELWKEAHDFLKMHGLRTFTFTRGFEAYVVFPCSYCITDRDWSERFQHVIYGYRSHSHFLRLCSSTIPQFNE